MHALGRQNLIHVAEVLRQQGANLCTGEIIDANLHDPFEVARLCRLACKVTGAPTKQ